jgi:YD repeat-containing protein
MSQLQQVSMARPVGTGTVTQTRTFAWADTDLTSATDPETGQTTYAYGGSHLLSQRTDAKGQVTRYGYDLFNRLSQVSHGVMSGGNFQESATQRVNYYYDQAPRGSTWGISILRGATMGGWRGLRTTIRATA